MQYTILSKTGSIVSQITNNQDTTAVAKVTHSINNTIKQLLKLQNDYSQRLSVEHFAERQAQQQAFNEQCKQDAQAVRRSNEQQTINLLQQQINNLEQQINYLQQALKGGINND